MTGNYLQLYIHLVFAVKYRDACIHPSWVKDLYSYIGAVIKTDKGMPKMIGGMFDHIHILAGFGADVPISKLVKDIKTSSTNWINTNRLVRGHFHWQEGYGGFTVSRSKVETVSNYIANQPEHHKKISFREEYRQLILLHGLEYFEDKGFDELI